MKFSITSIFNIALNNFSVLVMSPKMNKKRWTNTSLEVFVL